ncbi:hypothetical protein [Lacipirellula sp.]|uniref:hypothetical protein n=1 Tax=Lacipirellula sp. TaxID=2691419 RepID=UPI003D09C62A
MMRTSLRQGVLRLSLVGLSGGAWLGLVSTTHAGISYATAEGLYTENFNTLPTNPANGSLGSTPGGWIDDTAAPAGGNFSLAGFHLWHPTVVSPEGGSNGHQRLRAGSGSSGTGAFYSFGATTSSTERALGMVNSATVTPNGDSAYIGLQLVNNTGVTLNSFTLSYNGKQFRSGADSGETLAFAYSTTATDADWFSTATYNSVAALNFTAPVVTATSASVNPANVVPISSTVGFSWAPGAELWLRWADTQITSKDDDGLAIDDLQFSASTAAGPSLTVNSATTGPALTPSTWANNQAPDALHNYHVLSGHTVTVNGAFPGTELRALSGGVINISAAGNGQAIPKITVEAGGNLTETVSGAFTLGSAALLADASLASAQGELQTAQDLVFNADAGADVAIGLRLSGAGNIDVNSNGAGSDLIISDASSHTGTIRFNGTGDQVRLVKDKDFGRIDMNSTGENAFIYANTAQVIGGVLTYNQNGKIDHAATGNRIVQPSVINTTDKTVTVDLSKSFPTDERRFILENTLQGSGALNVVGSATDPTNLGSGGTNGTTLNEFELGTQTEPTTLANNSFTGVLTASDYVNIELRKNLRGAKIVVNNHAVVDMGHPVVELTKIYEYGEIQVNNGGTLEVGFEASIAGSQIGRHVAELALVSGSGRSGSLTLGDGSTTVMQINGTGAHQYDTITAAGNVTLDGTLKIVVNPAAFTGTNSTYNPTLGDVFPLITLTGTSFAAADFNHSGAVDAADLSVWKMAFGSTNLGDANSDGVTDGSDFLVWQRQFGTTSGISGNFDALVVEDPSGYMAGAGLAFQLSKTATALNLTVVSASPLAALPEPTSLLLVGAAIPLLVAGNRRRSAHQA